MSTMVEVEVDGEQCDISQPTECSTDMPEFINKLNELQEAGLGSVFLLAATAISLTLANNPATAGAWLSFLSTPVGPMVAGHALSPKLWVNEGLMSFFFFVVGLEIKQELRLGRYGTVQVPQCRRVPTSADDRRLDRRPLLLRALRMLHATI